jgi:taurine-pyruvate aminotransferase
VPGRNNVLCFSPSLIVTPEEVALITDTVDKALTEVFG